MPGYSKQILLSPLEDKYLCTACKLILSEPVQTYCGHRYCHSCVDEITSQPGIHKCIACGDEYQNDVDTTITAEQVFPDNAIKRELSGLNVQCINTGCNWKGVFRTYQEHAATCDFELINCIRSGCGEKILRRSLAEHLEDSCQMRDVHCHYCKEEVVWRDLKRHHRKCPEYLITCKFCGKKGIPRGKFTEHTDAEIGDCKKKVGLCKFKKVGCDDLVELEEMSKHDEEAQVKHLDMLFGVISQLMVQLDAMKVDPDAPTMSQKMEEHTGKLAMIETTVHRLEREVADTIAKINGQQGQQSTRDVQTIIDKQSRSIDELKAKTVVLDTKVSTYEGIVAVLNGQIERDANVVQAMERERKQDRDLVESLERKIKSQDRIIALKDVALAEQDLRIQSLELASYDGVLVWKISDFKRKRNDALSGRTTSIYSPCFFTSRHGYKMCARIYLNGDGMGKGNHVSLFFVIMRGTFDGLLRWPFRQKVTFMLLDQNNREHVIDAFRPDPTSNSFKRPTGDMNIASGCPLFMPLSQLDSSRYAYVKDDCIFVKVIVDTTDLN